MIKHGMRQLSCSVSALAVFLTWAGALCLPVSSAWADNEDQLSLELYNGGTTETVFANRSPRPASQTAENITVVTSQEIEALNAHSLADILAMVPGLQLESDRTPGTSANLEIQGSSFNHVLVLVDNIPINNLTANFADIASIPAQIIERVEIVKGAASTSWGSALGGVVNVITKTPQLERPFGGLVSGSLGKRTTADTRGEVSGTMGGIGYYASGGNLRSDGLLPNNWINQSNGYAKLHYDLPVRGSVGLSALYINGTSGQTQSGTIKADQKGDQLFSTLSLQYPLSDHLSFEGAFKAKVNNQELKRIQGDTVLQLSNTEESSVGGSLSLFWLSEMQRVVAGVDYDHAQAHLLQFGNALPPQAQGDLLNRSAHRVGVYLNDTFTLGNFALTPSVRYDHTGTGDDLFNPSLGVTYALTENSVLRGYTSRGYSITSLNQQNVVEEVWTSQIGVESGDIPYLWVKGTLFRNDTWNVSTNDEAQKQRQLKQGCELELRTLPFFDTSLSAGYTFIDARDGDTDQVLPLVPRHTLVVAVKYQDQHNFRALLTGRYIDWNGHRRNGKYDDVIWDLHLAKKFSLGSYPSVELFLSVRNLFNGDSYVSDLFKNAGTWGEAGVRCNF